jgi:hypothetical protein
LPESDAVPIAAMPIRSDQVFMSPSAVMIDSRLTRMVVNAPLGGGKPPFMRNGVLALGGYGRRRGHGRRNTSARLPRVKAVATTKATITGANRAVT